MDVQQLPERLFQLRRQMNLDQHEMGNLLGVSREWVSKLENGKGKFSRAVLAGMELHERERKSVAHSVAEPPAPYIKSRSQTPGTRTGAPIRLSPMVDPRHASKPSPIGRSEVESYLALLLDAATDDGEPENFSYILRMLKKHLPLDEFSPKERKI